LQIIFHNRATKYRALLRKMTYKDKGSYESSPPCTTSDMHKSTHTKRNACVSLFSTNTHGPTLSFFLFLFLACFLCLSLCYIHIHLHKKRYSYTRIIDMKRDLHTHEKRRAKKKKLRDRTRDRTYLKWESGRGPHIPKKDSYRHKKRPAYTTRKKRRLNTPIVHMEREPVQKRKDLRNRLR